MTASVVGGARVVISADAAAFGREARAEIEASIKQLGPVTAKSIDLLVPIFARAGTASGEAFAEAATKAALAGMKALGVETAGQLRAISDAAVKSAAEQSAANDRVTTSTQRTTRSRISDGDAAKALSDAAARLATIQADLAGVNTKVAIATLRNVSAQERAVAASTEAGSAAQLEARELARLASTQASAIGAADRLAAAERGVAVSSVAMGAGAQKAEGALAGTLKTAGELGLVFGAFEAVKKAIDITHEANDYQRQMVQIGNLTGATKAQVAGLSSTLLDMAGKVAQSPEDLAVSAYHAESSLRKLGATAPQIYKAVETASKGAIIGNTDLEDTTNSLTATLASGIVPITQTSKAMGSLLAIVGAGDMKVSDLNDALGTGLLVTMRTFGVSLTDSGAALAVFGDNNIRGADAATKLRLSVQDIAKPAADADKYLSQINLTSDQLRASLEKNGLNGALTLLKSKLDAAGISGKQIGPFLEDAFTKKAGAGLALLLTRMDQFDEARKQITAGAGSFGAQWAAASKTASFELKALGAEAEADGIKIAQKLGPDVAVAAHALAVGLPAAVHLVADALHPFVTAWDEADKVLGPVGHVVASVAGDLEPIAPILEKVGGAALTMFLAFKGYEIARAAATAVNLALGSVVGSALKAEIRTKAWAIGTQATFAGNATAAERAALVEAQAAADAAAAQSTAAAETQAAGARIAVTYADQVAASSAATDVQVSNAVELAAAQNAAAVSAAGSAAETAAAAEGAAAAVAGAGEEAAIGWGAIAGPIGIAVGAVALFGSSLLGQSHDSRTAAAANSAYADSVKTSTDALGEANVASTTRQLADSKAYQSLQQLSAGNKNLGLTQNDLTEAVNGTQKQYDAVVAKIKAATFAGGANSKQFAQNIVSGGKLTSTLKTLRDSLAGNISTQKDYKTAQAASAAITNKSATAAQKAANAEKEQAAETKALAAALQNLAQTQLAALQSEDSFREGLMQVTTTVKQNGDSLSKNTKGGLANRDMLIGLAGQAVSLAQAQEKQKAKTEGQSAAIADSTVALAANVRQIEATATAAGLSKIQVSALIKQMGLTPKQIGTKFDVDTQSATAKIAAFQSDINHLYGKSVQVRADTSSAVASIQRLIDTRATKYVQVVTVGAGQAPSGGHTDLPVGHSAAGSRSWAPNGKLPPGLSTVGERGWELVKTDSSGRSEVVNHETSMAITGLPSILPGYAGGTNPSGITHSGKDWIYAGIRYASERAAENAQTRATAPSKTYAGVNGQTYSSAQAAANALVRAQQTLTKELPKFSKAVAGTTEQLRSAETTLFNDAKATGATQKSLALITNDFGRLNKLATKRDSLQARLGSASKLAAPSAYDQLAADQQTFADEAKTVTDAFMNGFSILTAGQQSSAPTGAQENAFQGALARWNGGGGLKDGDIQLLTDGDPATADAGSQPYSVAGAITAGQAQIALERKVKRELADLHRKGLSDALYQQLSEGGVGAAGQIDSLDHASKSQLATLSSQFSTIGTLSAGAGNAGAQIIDGAAVTHDEGVIKTLQTDIATTKAEMRAQTKSIVDAIHGIAGQLNGATGRANLHSRTMPAGKK